MTLMFNGEEVLNYEFDGQPVETIVFNGEVVARKPTITTQPKGATINDLQTHKVSVVADGLGSTMTYQWYKNGTAISGATGASYTFDPTSTGSWTFYCRVSGFGGYTQTATVTVKVVASERVTQHNLKVGSNSSSDSVGYIYGGSQAMGTFTGDVEVGQTGAHVLVKVSNFWTAPSYSKNLHFQLVSADGGLFANGRAFSVSVRAPNVGIGWGTAGTLTYVDHGGYGDWRFTIKEGGTQALNNYMISHVGSTILIEIKIE